VNTSAEARIVASFTFIVALMLGAWGALDHLLVGPDPFLLTEPEPGRFVIALLPVAATVVAFRATKAVTAAWARTLGSATVMLGVLSSLAGVIYFVSAW
jgi:hypothetical protein